MATILLFMSLEAGHILPTIKFAADLVSLGHDVVYQCCGALPDELGRFGFRSVPFFPNLSHAGVERSLLSAEASAPQFYDHLQTQFRNERSFLFALTTEIVRTVESVKPDLVLLDGIKRTVYPAYRQLSKRWRVGRVAPNLRAILPVEQAHGFGRLIFLCPSQFEIPSSVEPKARYAEPSIFPGWGEDGDHVSQKHGGRPLIYVSFGSQIQEYMQITKVLSEIRDTALAGEWDFVVNAGVYANALKVAGSDRLIISSRPPHLQTLHRASVMITHGGLGTVKDCVVNCVPMLVIPQRWDQPANAERVTHHHLGRAIPASEVTASRVSAAIADLLSNKRYVEGLAKMHKVFCYPREEQRVANICEDILLDRYPVDGEI